MRTWIVIIAIFIVTAVYSIAVLAHMALWRDKDVFFLYARSWSQILLKLSGITVDIDGQENVKPGQRYVYIANHASLFDIPVVLASVPDNVRIMYKKELERIPFLGWCLRMSPFIGIIREQSRDAANVIDAVVASMASGSSVLVFPEGTRSADGRVQNFRRGAFSLAVRSGRPLIPLSLIGTAAILPKQTRTIQGGTVRLVIGAPIQPPAQSGREQEKALMLDMHHIISDTVDS